MFCFVISLRRPVFKNECIRMFGTVCLKSCVIGLIQGQGQTLLFLNDGLV